MIIIKRSDAPSHRATLRFIVVVCASAFVTGTVRAQALETVAAIEKIMRAKGVALPPLPTPKRGKRYR